MHHGISATDYAHFWILFSVLAAIPLGTLAWFYLRALRHIARGLEHLVLVALIATHDERGYGTRKGGERVLEQPTQRRLN